MNYNWNKPSQTFWKLLIFKLYVYNMVYNSWLIAITIGEIEIITLFANCKIIICRYASFFFFFLTIKEASKLACMITRSSSYWILFWLSFMTFFLFSNREVSWIWGLTSENTLMKVGFLTSNRVPGGGVVLAYHPLLYSKTKSRRVNFHCFFFF